MLGAVVLLPLLAVSEMNDSANSYHVIASAEMFWLEEAGGGCAAFAAGAGAERGFAAHRSH